MACRKHYRDLAAKYTVVEPRPIVKEIAANNTQVGLLFGVDSVSRADDLLQNNISMFEWAVRNKIPPNFWGRHLLGENCLTENEIVFIHSKGCRIAPICYEKGEKLTEEQGAKLGEKASARALELKIPENTAIFLDVPDEEEVSTAFMKGFAKVLLSEDFVPGFKANTDAAVSFDREFSRGLQTDRDIFQWCVIWASAPSLREYHRMTTTHLLHPDEWMPYAPSGITRNDIAVWEYGRECHPIHNDAGTEVVFNINLVKNSQVILKKMF
jgi:hypothetical protein